MKPYSVSELRTIIRLHKAGYTTKKVAQVLGRPLPGLRQKVKSMELRFRRPADIADQFDANLYTLMGNKKRPIGRASKINRADAERIVTLNRAFHLAGDTLRELLIKRGYTTPATRAGVVMRLRSGWRPQQ